MMAAHIAAYAAPMRGPKEVAMVFKPIVVASALALLPIVPAAQSWADQQLTVAPAKLAAVASCEADMRRLAGLNKTIGANYNATHVDEVCAAGE
jgi:hypothetical protein